VVTNTQDIYVSLIQYQSVRTGGSNSAKYLLAATLGPLVVGLVLISLVFVRRRRQAYP
jgi:hypothetical protein